MYKTANVERPRRTIDALVTNDPKKNTLLQGLGLAHDGAKLTYWN